MSPLFKLMLFCLVFLALFKDDSAVIAGSAYWSDLAWDPISLVLKKLSIYVGVGGMAAAVALIAISPKYSIRRGGVSSVYVALASYAAFRGWFYSDEAAWKLFQGWVLLVLVLGAVEFYIVAKGESVYLAGFVDVLFVMSLVLISLNIYGYSLGYGYVPGNPRYFGTSAHPNFIGVQLAICNISLWAAFRRSESFLVSTLCVVFMGLGLFLQTATGSRTGLAVVVIGMAAFFAASVRFRLQKGVLYGALILLVVCSLLYFFLIPDLSDAFDRGDQGYDTRSEAWASLIGNVLSNPVFGVGYFVGFSENSYLRAASAFGIPYALILLWIVVRVLFLLYQANRRSSVVGTEVALCYALAVALTAGGVLEGFLVDSLSFPMIVFVLVAAVCSKRLVSKTRVKT